MSAADFLATSWWTTPIRAELMFNASSGPDESPKSL